MTMPTGHPRESDLRWHTSPMWLAMMDAAIACGVEDRMDAARITDAKVWARIGDKNWPSEDKATRDRFHALWTANVQARCGIDPEQAAPVATAPTAAQQQRRDLEEVRRLAVARYEETAQTMTEVADTFGIKRDTLARYLCDAGVLIRPTDARKAAAVRWADPSARERMAERMRQRHQAMKERAHAA